MARKILIADDHVAVRRGVEALLRDEFPRCEFDLASSQPELNEKLQSAKWDLVLLDLSMPGRSTLECVREIKDRTPSTAVLIYTGHPEDQLGMRALRAGADGYVTKDASAEELLRAVHRVLKGKRYISDTMAERMADMISHPVSGAAHDLLSDREYQILKLLGAGVSPSAIALDLHLSIKTVSTYRKRILEKLQLHSTAELIRYAVEHDIR